MIPTKSIYNFWIEQGMSEDDILEMFEYDKRTPKIEADINWKLINKHTPEIQPFIKNLSLENSEKFIALINTNIGGYLYQVNIFNNVQLAREWSRDNKALNLHKKQMKIPIEDLKSKIKNNPRNKELLSLLNDFETIFNQGLEELSIENIGLSRPTKKDVISQIKRDMIMFDIKANDSQIKKLQQIIPKH